MRRIADNPTDSPSFFRGVGTKGDYALKEIVLFRFSKSEISLNIYSNSGTCICIRASQSLRQLAKEILKRVPPRKRK